MMGLFSVLDVILGKTMEEALDMLKVSGKIVDMSDIRPYSLMQG